MTISARHLNIYKQPKWTIFGWIFLLGGGKCAKNDATSPYCCWWCNQFQSYLSGACVWHYKFNVFKTTITSMQMIQVKSVICIRWAMSEKKESALTWTFLHFFFNLDKQHLDDLANLKLVDLNYSTNSPLTNYKTKRPRVFGVWFVFDQ